MEYLKNNRCSKLLPNVKLKKEILITNDIKEVVLDADVVFHVTPSKNAVDTLKMYNEYLKETAYIVICSKGISENGKMLSEEFEKYVSKEKIAVLTGPTHAEEIAEKKLSAMVIASINEEVKNKVIEIFASSYIRLYKSNDIIGVQIGGALKNVIAFCSGIIIGMGEGDNTLAAICTRGLSEISRFSEKYGSNSKTIYGLSGLGDLLVTCLSEHSRNRKAGILLSQGKTLEEVRKEVGMVIEGLENLKTVKEMADSLNVEMPIINALYNVVYKNKEIREEINNLMSRDMKEEY